MKGFVYIKNEGSELESKEISVPDADVSITIVGSDHFIAIGTGKQLEKIEPVKEVEVPDELVVAAQEMVRAQIKFGSMRQIFEDLTKE